MDFSLVRDIVPITEFKKRMKAILDQVHRNGRPVVLTVNGKADTVIMDVRQYEKQAQEYEMLVQMRTAEKEFEQGKAVPFRKAFKELKRGAKKI